MAGKEKKRREGSHKACEKGKVVVHKYEYRSTIFLTGDLVVTPAESAGLRLVSWRYGSGGKKLKNKKGGGLG